MLKWSVNLCFTFLLKAFLLLLKNLYIWLMLCPDYYITMMFLEDWCEKRRLFRFKTTNGVILKNSQNLTNLCLQHAILFYMNMNNVEFFHLWISLLVWEEFLTDRLPKFKMSLLPPRWEHSLLCGNQSLTLQP